MCAALCVFGSTIGLLIVLHELTFHVQYPAHAIGLVGSSLCVGIVLGLWIPRRMIRRRLAPSPDAGQPASVEPEFAASLAGSLILLSGLGWLLLGGGALRMETYRAFIVARFVLPAGLMPVVLLLPACFGTAFVGAICTATLTAGRGWFRLVSPAAAGTGVLWATMLLAGALAGAVATVAPNAATLMIVSLLAIFAAGVLAVYRPPRGAGANPPQPSTTSASAGAGSWLVMSTASASAGVACALALPNASPAMAQLGAALGVLALSWLTGMLLAGRGTAERTQLTPFLLLASAAVWALAPHLTAEPGRLALLRLAGVGCCAAASMVLIGRRFATGGNDARHMPARVAGYAAAVTGLALALGTIAAGRIDTGNISIVIALATTAVAGLVLLLSPEISPALRIAGSAMVAAWLGVVFLFGGLEAPANAAGQPCERAVADRPAARVARALWKGPGTAEVCVRRQPSSAPGRFRRGWRIDLSGPRYTCVVISSPQPAGDRQDEHADRRLIRRCASALVRGGHLVLELPADELAGPALDFLRRDPLAEGWDGCLLRVTGPDGAYAAVLMGPSVAAWVEHHPWPTGFDATTHELHSRHDLGQFVPAVADEP